MRIEKGLKKVPGVKEASVNLATERANVMYDPTQTNVEQMVQKVDAVGYKATPLVTPTKKPVLQEIEPEAHVVLDLEGMTCASCAMRIEKGLKKVPGVKEANVNLATEQANVTYDPAADRSGTDGAEGRGRRLQSHSTRAVQRWKRCRPIPQAADSDPLAAPAGDLFQEDEQGKRKRAEIVRKRNLLILGIVLLIACGHPQHVFHESVSWRELSPAGAYHSGLGGRRLGVPPGSHQDLAPR